jgi:Mrp family chromosome partitioning ATPase
MSRNFELLTQMQYELSPSEGLARATPKRPAAKVFAPTKTSGAYPQEMLRLVQNVFLGANDSAPRQVIFCGVDDQNDSSSICASAGRILAADNSRSVCLIDANLRSPRLSDIFSVPIAILCSGKPASPRENCVEVGSNLWLTGINLLADEHGALHTPIELKQILAELRGIFDYILIDAPGINTCGDAASLGQVADATILVVEAGSTRRMSARKAKESLDAAGVRLLGTVLYNRSFPIPERLYQRL